MANIAKATAIIVAGAVLGGVLFSGSEPALPSSSTGASPPSKPVPKPPSIPSRPATTKIDSSNCHPSYSGCLKRNAGDYDCAGGSGNGPNYTGPVRVNGSDPFDLDRDDDGWGCE